MAVRPTSCLEWALGPVAYANGAAVAINRRELNFASPLQGRKWLSLLREDPISGIRVKPNLSLPAGVLGFSFNSNSLGLRGPENTKSANVLFGTSYAMGFAVDIGLNWYDRALHASEWLNLGLPVGPPQMKALLEYYYTGAARTALVLYHPNFWAHALRYQQWASSGQPLFSYLGWKTNWFSCMRLVQQKRKRAAEALKKGWAHIFVHDGVRYHIDCLYSQFDFVASQRGLMDSIQVWKEMLSGFDNVLVVRVPIKQELVPEAESNSFLRATNESYDEGWRLAQKHLASRRSIQFVRADAFQLSDYHPWDTHWNAQGHQTFADALRTLL